MADRLRQLDNADISLGADIEALVDRTLREIRAVYREIGPGLSEGIYHEALEIALSEAGIAYASKPRLRVAFRGRVLQRHAEPDFLIGEFLVVELKAVEEFHPGHEAQLLTYLRHTQRPVGFLVNFRAPRLAAGLKRMVLTSVASS